MGLFKPNYLKPGKGISPDEPEKRSFFRYWEILKDKFSKILGLNIIYVLLSLPFIAIIFLLIPINYDWLKNLVPQIDEASISAIYVLFKLFLSLVIFSVFGSGPVSAVYAYISRCFTNRVPVWVIADGKDAFKSNFKQSMMLVMLDIVIIFLALTAITFYTSNYIQTQNTLMGIASVVVMVGFVIYAWMHYYIYQLMVTFQLTLRHIFKNAFIFTICSLPKNIIFTLISFVVTYILFMYLDTFVAIVIYIPLAPIFTRFIAEFSATNRITPFAKKAKEQETKEEVTIQ